MMDTPDIEPLETLYEEGGNELPLPAELAALYGRLIFPAQTDRPYVIANFVTSLDGVVSLSNSGITGGGEISGNNRHDHSVMGLLRSIADAVIVGAGTQRSAPRHLWTAAYIYPPLAGAYRQLRDSLGITEPPLTVIVTARGNINLTRPVFRSAETPVLIVTTANGAQRIHEQSLPAHVQVRAIESNVRISARDVLEAVQHVRACRYILVEGGPQLMGDFFAGNSLDELFLTLSPQVVGRDETVERPGMVMDRRFAPEHPVWGRLSSVRRGGNHLFLRYSFPSFLKR